MPMRSSTAIHPGIRRPRPLRIASKPSPMKHSLMLAMALGVLALPLQATATCGTGHPPSYADISAVMFERRGCGGFPKTQPSKDLRCSLYWVFITKWDTDDDATYSQFNFPGQTGTYKISLTLSDVRALLREHDFFNLNPEDASVTDIRQSVLSVKRCGVVTRVMMYPKFVSVDKPTAALFAAFDALIAGATKHRLSGKPAEFPYTAIFDGE
jgi:hypothetical protein